MQTPPTVAVVILNYNGRKYLEKFLPVLLQSTYTPCNYYVADNNSSDHSVDMIRQHFPNVNIIEIKQNEGYAKGYNTALKQIVADIYVLLNQDVEITSRWIESVVELFMRNENLAAVQPKILSYKNKNQFEYAGAAGGFLDWLGYSFCRGRLFTTTETDRGQYDDICEIFWASGACLFIKAAAFHQVGRFDDDFFAHYEEIDLCWRLQNAGYKIMCCPTSVVYHVGGSSLPYGNPRKTYLNYRNNLLALIKNYYSPLSTLVIFLRIMLDGLSAAKLFFSGYFADVWAIFMAHVYVYLHFKDIINKRKQTQKLLLQINKDIPTFSRLAGTYSRSVLVDYFILRKKKFADLRWSR